MAVRWHPYCCTDTLDCRCTLQAAAHGVPTVATKNGGPVDIMATLHHGLLVDPTNSKQIADALIRILTNSQVWDEMSQNGEHIFTAHGSLDAQRCLL